MEGLGPRCSLERRAPAQGWVTRDLRGPAPAKKALGSSPPPRPCEWPETQATQMQKVKGKPKLPGMPSERRRNLKCQELLKLGKRGSTRQTRSEPQYSRDVSRWRKGGPVDPIHITRGEQESTRCQEFS